MKLTFVAFCLWTVVCNAGEFDLLQNYRVIKQDNHEIHLLDVPAQKYNIRLVKAPSGTRDTVLEISRANHALAAVNAGFFHTGEDQEGKPAGVLKINGQWLGYSRLPRGALGWNENLTVVRIDRITAKKNPKSQRVQVNPQRWQDLTYIVQGTPLLIKNGKIVRNYGPERTQATFLFQPHARTAVCIKKNKHWLFVVASHTKAEDKPYVEKPLLGLTIPELSEFLLREGCWDAVNLDGGGSSTLVLQDKVMNDNAGDRLPLGDIYRERPVSDAIIITEKSPLSP